jgi:hypothetical protein
MNQQEPKPEMSLNEIVIANDVKLVDLVKYEITKGLTISVKESDKVIQEKFAEFKRYILTGEFTLAQLEADIYNKWGITEPVNLSGISHNACSDKAGGNDDNTSNKILGFSDN